MSVAPQRFRHAGQFLTIREWSLRLTVPPGVLRYRLTQSWPMERIFTADRKSDAAGRLRCSQCRCYRPLSDFSRKSRAASGLSASCRSCAVRIGKKQRSTESFRAWRRDFERAYRKRYPEKVRAKARDYVHRKRAGGGHVSAKDWLALQEKHSYACAYCLTITTLTQDHVIPLSKGGKHDISNIVPACQPCNSAKRDRLGWDPLLDAA